jgi:hypothetical protein
MTLSDRDKALIMKFLTGGAAVGAGVGLGQSGLNYMQFLKQRADRDKATDKDDDTLYLSLPAEKRAASLGGGLAIAGGGLSLLAANALVRKLYQRMLKKPELQAELDAAQHRHLGVVTDLSKTAAGKPMSGMELLTSSPVALAILTALASGTLGYQALNRTFPSVEKPRNPLPSKVRITRKPEEAVIEKDASWDDDAESAAWEYATRHMLCLKAATDLSDWVSAAASGRYEELKDNLADLGFEAASDLVKGASTHAPVSDKALDLAVPLLVKSAVLGPVFRLMVAAEICEAYPAYVKIASGLDDEDAGALVGWLAVEGAAHRAKLLTPVVVPFLKSAAAQGKGVESMLRQLLQQQLNNEDAGDMKTMQERVAANQTVAGSASETGAGEESDGASIDQKGDDPEVPDVPELVMGMK